jgi:hypothetical protein
MNRKQQADDPRLQIRAVVAEIQKEEGCGVVDALMAFSHRAVLAGMSRIPACYDQLILKGGTALRLSYGHPIGRVSTDLDLSLLECRDSFDVLLITSDVTREVANVLAESFSDSAQITIRLIADRSKPDYSELPKMYSFRMTTEAFLNGPGRSATKVDSKAFLIELAIDEPVEKESLSVLELTEHGMPIRLQMYAPVQAMAEKLRALLQKHHHFDRTADVASFQPRHVFDLRLLYDQLGPGDLERLKPLFNMKCDSRSIPAGERTRARMLNPALRAAVQAEADRRGLPMAAWLRLEGLAQLVCDQ